MTTTLKNLIERDLEKYYLACGEDNEGKINLKYIGKYSESKKNVILYFDDIYLYENPVTLKDIESGVINMIYYQTSSKRLSFTAIIDKTIEYDITKSVKCHFEIRCYDNSNKYIIVEKIDLFPGNENIIYMLSNIIGGYV